VRNKNNDRYIYEVFIEEEKQSPVNGDDLTWLIAVAIKIAIESTHSYHE